MASLLATFRECLYLDSQSPLIGAFSEPVRNGYNLVVANLPAKVPQSSVSDDHVDRLVAYMAQGVHPRELARRIHPKDRVARLRTYRRLKATALTDPRAQQRLVEEANLAMMVDLVPIVQALGKSAKRGRADTAKLVLEASGFHNPKSRVEHSGEIKIKLDMPRPTFNEPDGIVDADVVD